MPSQRQTCCCHSETKCKVLHENSHICPDDKFIGLEQIADLTSVSATVAEADLALDSRALCTCETLQNFSIASGTAPVESVCTVLVANYCAWCLQS